MDRASKIKAKIEKLQRELAEVEEGIVEVYPGETFRRPPDGIKEIRAHMPPITSIEFCKDRIVLWGGEQCLNLNIVSRIENEELTLKVVR